MDRKRKYAREPSRGKPSAARPFQKRKSPEEWDVPPRAGSLPCKCPKVVATGVPPVLTLEECHILCEADPHCWALRKMAVKPVHARDVVNAVFGTELVAEERYSELLSIIREGVRMRDETVGVAFKRLLRQSENERRVSTMALCILAHARTPASRYATLLRWPMGCPNGHIRVRKDSTGPVLISLRPTPDKGRFEVKCGMCPPGKCITWNPLTLMSRGISAHNGTWESAHEFTLHVDLMRLGMSWAAFLDGVSWARRRPQSRSALTKWAKSPYFGDVLLRIIRAFL